MGPAEQWASPEARGVMSTVTAGQQAWTAKRLESSGTDHSGGKGRHLGQDLAREAVSTDDTVKARSLENEKK